MRKLLATLAVSLTALGAAAGTAAADDPNAYSFQTHAYSLPGTVNYGWGCKTPYKTGVLGGWGYYIDGCTTGSVKCASARPCTVWSDSYIHVNNNPGHAVTMNARIRLYDPYGRVQWLDRSCSGTNYCSPANLKFYDVPSGWTATAQCNGVRQIAAATAQDTCTVKIKTQ